MIELQHGFIKFRNTSIKLDSHHNQKLILDSLLPIQLPKVKAHSVETVFIETPQTKVFLVDIPSIKLVV